MDLVKCLRQACLLIVFVGYTSVCVAQQPQGPVGSRPSVTTQSTKTPAENPAAVEAGENKSKAQDTSAGSEGADADLLTLKSDFALLKILGLISVAAAASLGLAWYAVRHKRLQSFDTLGGIALAAIAAPIFLAAATMVLSTDSGACLGLSLGAGADSSAFFDACRAAREGMANMVGLKSAWSTVFGQTISNGVVVAYSAAVIKALMYASVCIGAPLLFLLFKPLLKTILYKR
jgi:hypothetical protein